MDVIKSFNDSGYSLVEYLDIPIITTRCKEISIVGANIDPESGLEHCC